MIELMPANDPGADAQKRSRGFQPGIRHIALRVTDFDSAYATIEIRSASDSIPKPAKPSAAEKPSSSATRKETNYRLCRGKKWSLSFVRGHCLKRLSRTVTRPATWQRTNDQGQMTKDK